MIQVKRFAEQTECPGNSNKKPKLESNLGFNFSWTNLFSLLHFVLQ